MTESLQPQWKMYGAESSLQAPFDVAVIIPSIGRPSLLQAIASVYAQSKKLRIQLLIGIDAPKGDFKAIETLLSSTPTHVTACFFYPGYSTSVRHGGLHPARDGGVLRTVLSYLANARLISYLDDDNWWDPEHLANLVDAIKGREWAFSLRRFIHPVTRHPVATDQWESVGIKKGIFSEKFGGFVDPNCLLIDKGLCEPVLRWWGIPLPNDINAMSADRHVFHWLAQKSPPGETMSVTVNYVMQDEDLIHPIRLNLIGEKSYVEAGCVK